MAFSVKEVGLNPRHALFTPSLSPMYVKCQGTYSGRMPGPLTLDDFDFYNKNRFDFRWPAALYAAGHAADLELKNYNTERMVTLRDKKDTIMVCDSGGYQIGRGVLEMDKDLRSAKADDLRIQIMKWLEAHADYAMILDWPAWAVGTPKFRLNSFRECLDETKYNNDLFVKNRTKGHARFLNVVQGTNWVWQNNSKPRLGEGVGDIPTWLNEVKHYPFEGWAVAGPPAGDIVYFLYFILTLWKEGLFEGRKWIHVLGKSRPDSAYIMTVINDCIQRYIDPDIQISYDSASAFLYSINGQILPWYDALNFSIATDKIPNDIKYVGSSSLLPLPEQSPMTKLLTCGDFCVKLEKNLDYTNIFKDEETGELLEHTTKKEGFMDTMSYMISMYHNIWVQNECVQMFSEMALMDPIELYKLQDYFIKERHRLWPEKTGFVWPRKLDEKRMIEEIFKTRDPDKALDVLTGYESLLHNAAKTALAKETNNSGELFDITFAPKKVLTDKEEKEEKKRLKKEKEKNKDPESRPAGLFD